VTATVPCGSMLCQVGNGGRCCVTGTIGAPGYTCISSGSCSAVSGSIAPLNCNSEVDCPSGQICCGTGNATSFGTDCVVAASCKGGQNFSAMQVCDPALSTPTECTTGACTGTFSQDPALSTCQ
jgi:hypothetical protein